MGLRSVNHIVSATAQGQELFPCSSVVSFPWQTALHKLQCETIPQGTVLHKLLECVNFPHTALLQAQPAPV